MTHHTAVVALDGSVTAEAVLSWATMLARSLRLRLLLLTVISDTPLHTEHDGPPSDHAARDYLDGVAASLQGDGLMLETQVVAAERDIAGAINTVAANVDAALILIATHGYSGFDRWMLGSTAETVVRTATRPILVVGATAALDRAKPASIDRILVPLDGFRFAEAAVPVAISLARALGAVLDLVHVVPRPWTFVADISETIERQLGEAATVYLERLAAQIPQDVKVEGHVRQGSPAAAILDYREAAAAGLIVMSTHGRSGLRRWALGSVADRVLHASDRPVLLVRPAADDSAHALFAVEERAGVAPGSGESNGVS